MLFRSLEVLNEITSFLNIPQIDSSLQNVEFLEFHLDSDRNIAFLSFQPFIKSKLAWSCIIGAGSGTCTQSVVEMSPAKLHIHLFSLML